MLKKSTFGGALYINGVMEIEIMAVKKIRRLWNFEFYDFELINTYLNERASQGEALEYIGTVFGVYKKTMPGEYKYCVDYIETCDVNSEEFENYKKTWIDERWEYVDFLEGVIIFRCKKRDRCMQPSINLDKIREAIFLKVKNQKFQWLQSATWILLTALNILLDVTEFKLGLTIIAAIQFLQFDSFLAYLNLRKRRKAGFTYQYNQFTAQKRNKKIRMLRSLKELLLGILFILLPLTLIFYYKYTFFAKCAILVSVAIIGSKIYGSIKIYNEKRENKFNFESAKGKFLMISIGMLVTIAVILSFVMIDQSKPKRDMIKAVPCIVLDCDDKVNYVNHHYGKWNYEYTKGISVGSEEGFQLPKPNEIESINIGNDSTVDISSLPEPNKMEIRYWKRDDFNKLKSYDKGYKEIEMKNGSFTVLKENVVYVVYAEWKKKLYDGVGYYVFTIERK